MLLFFRSPNRPNIELFGSRFVKIGYHIIKALNRLASLNFPAKNKQPGSLITSIY